MTARLLRLHYPDGKVITEPLTRTARANGLTNAIEARALVDEWLLAGDVTRRPDGGLDVKRKRPRPDTQRVAEMRARRDTDDLLDHLDEQLA